MQNAKSLRFHELLAIRGVLAVAAAFLIVFTILGEETLAEFVVLGLTISGLPILWFMRARLDGYLVLLMVSIWVFGRQLWF